MGTTTRRSMAVVAAAAAGALALWAVIRLLGIDLTVQSGQGSSQVGAVEVLMTAVLAGLAAWVVQVVLARWRRRTWWPFIGSTAIAVSITGPAYLSDGIAAVALICLHLLVGIVLIVGFARYVPRPSRSAESRF